MSSSALAKPPTTSSTPSKLLVLISGGGTNLQALIDACNTSDLPHTSIIRVISNRKDAYGLTRAQKASIPTSYHNVVKYKRKHPPDEGGVQAAREEYDRDLAQMIVEDRPDLVVCAGWMHILSLVFIDILQRAEIAIINLHPALPGRFNGAAAIGRAYEAFQRGEIVQTGVMVHYVMKDVDMGEPIVVREVEMNQGETEFELEERIHKVEWSIIVEGARRAVERIQQARNGVRE